MRFICLAILASTTVISAADSATSDVIQDLRLTVSRLPTNYDTHLENKSTGVSADGSGKLDDAYGILVGYQYSRYEGQVGFLVGAGLDYAATSEQANGIKDTTNNFGLSMDLGLGLRPIHPLRVELAVTGGIGASNEKVTGLFSKAIESSSGNYTKIGALARIVYTFGEHVEVLAQGGYLAFKQTLKYDADPSINLGQLEFENTMKGFTGGFGIGYQF